MIDNPLTPSEWGKMVQRACIARGVLQAGLDGKLPIDIYTLPRYCREMPDDKADDCSSARFGAEVVARRGEDVDLQ